MQSLASFDFSLSSAVIYEQTITQKRGKKNIYTRQKQTKKKRKNTFEMKPLNDAILDIPSRSDGQ